MYSEIHFYHCLKQQCQSIQDTLRIIISPGQNRFQASCMNYLVSGSNTIVKIGDSWSTRTPKGKGKLINTLSASGLWLYPHE